MARVLVIPVRWHDGMTPRHDEDSAEHSRAIPLVLGKPDAWQRRRVEEVELFRPFRRPTGSYPESGLKEVSRIGNDKSASVYNSPTE
jgi:hypothetical protein